MSGAARATPHDQKFGSVIAAGYELIAEHSDCHTRGGRKRDPRGVSKFFGEKKKID